MSSTETGPAGGGGGIKWGECKEAALSTLEEEEGKGEAFELGGNRWLILE